MGGDVIAQPSGAIGEAMARGQWAFPLHLDMTGNGLFPETHEIAHAAVLPPPEDGEGGYEDLTRVLFWNRINSVCDEGDPCLPGTQSGSGVLPPQTFGRAYSWQPDEVGRAQQLIQVAVDPATGSLNPDYDDVFGSESLFCGGQAFLPDGSLLVLGGTDRVEQCSANECASALGSPGFGHTTVLRLDTSVHPPAWMATDPIPDLNYPRWYGTGIPLADGSVFVGGHTGGPVTTYDEVADVVYWNAILGDIDFVQGGHVLSPPLTGSTGGTADYDCAALEDVVGLTDYPRLHLLSSGDLIEVTGTFRDADDEALEPRTRFQDRVAPVACDVDEWLEAPDHPAALRYGGNSVQLITWDPISDAFTEVIYAVGGGSSPNEALCDPGEAMTATVQKMVDPSQDALWVSVNGLDDEPLPGTSGGAPPVARPRKNHNTVILLDGSLLVVGGWTDADVDADGECDQVLEAERYRPTEVFDTVDPVWKDMSSQAIGRSYHAVAGLLPDGRVFAAGGVEEDSSGPTSARQTVEVYSPGYAFKARPSVDASTVPQSMTYGPPVSPSITISLVNDDPERAFDRVALIRASSATHAWDAGQRYVELPFDVDAGQPFDEFVIELEIPAKTPGQGGSGDFIIPPGHYLLTVIDKSNVPSSGHWVRIE